MSQLVFLIIGLAVGFWFGKHSREPENKKPVPSRVRQLTALERQKAKVGYATDADRIRELNLLTPTSSKFWSMLKREFDPLEIVIKNKRFFVVDADKFPIAIFEYRDGMQDLRAVDTEDGLPIFMYKNLPPSSQLRADKDELLRR